VSDGPYTTLDFCDDALADDQVQAMARRQFAVSLVVALALLLAAVALGSRTAGVSAAEVAARHRIVITHPETPRLEIGQPVFGAKARG
jgi:hypothetical protein